MADRWLTLADVYNPLENAVRIAQIKQMQQQQQLRQIAAQSAQIDLARKQDFMKMVGGGQGEMDIPPLFSGVPLPGVGPGPGGVGPGPGGVGPSGVGPGGQQAQMPAGQMTGQSITPDAQVDPKQAQIMRGEHKIKALTPILKEAVSGKTVNGITLNKANSMIKSDTDIQAAIHQQYDDIDIGYDEKTLKAWQRFKKTWTREELDSIADKFPGGSVLRGVPAGNFWVEYDPVNKRIMPTVKTEGAKKSEKIMGVLQDPTLTDTDLIRASLYGSPTERTRAKAILQGKSEYAAEAYGVKYGGGITEKGIKFGAEQYIYTGKMPPMGRSPRVRAQIMEMAADIAKTLNMSVPELMAMQSDKRGLALSLAQQIKQRGTMGSFVRNIETQVSELKNKIPELGRFDMRLANMPLRAFRNKIMGSAKERIFDTYLGEISSEIAKIAGGATGSVAEVTTSAREKWEEIHDPNLPAGEMMKLLDEIAHLGVIRLKSVDKEIEYTREKIGVSPLRNKKPVTKNRPMIGLPPARKHENRIINDGKGNRFKSDGEKWRRI